jgi:DNA-binding MarR family transcriptional regulator
MIALIRGQEHLGRFAEAARRVGLTMASIKALMTLEPGREIPMRALADELHCDASNVTQLVDTLEAPGYVERVPSPTDRRVKLLRITTLGGKARAEVIDALHRPPACFAALSGREQAELARLLTKAMAAADPPRPTHG